VKIKKNIHIIVIFSGLFISVYFFKGWENFIGYLGFLFLFSWNIYAFLNGRSMISIPKMIENVRINGSHEARYFLFVVSWGIIAIFSAGYIYKSALA